MFDHFAASTLCEGKHLKVPLHAVSVNNISTC